MTKTQKKIENSIRKALTDVCDIARIEVDGFLWLTHLVNYDNIPDSLVVICIFDTNEQLVAAQQSGKDSHIGQMIRTGLNNINIDTRYAEHLVSFDTEEDCTQEHAGKWNERLTVARYA